MSTYDEVALWNAKVGKLPKEVGTAQYWQELRNQASLITEELGELLEAIEKKDIEGVVDAGLDLDVVVAGLNYLSGSDYQRGIDLVLGNNDLKFNTEEEIVEQWKYFWEANGVECHVVTSTIHVPDGEDEVYYSLHRTEDDKVMKYAKFPKVDLSKSVPLPVKEQYVLVSSANVTKQVESSGLPVIMLDDLDDPTGTMKIVAENNDYKDLVLTITNGELVKVELLEE